MMYIIMLLVLDILANIALVKELNEIKKNISKNGTR